jgi:hypothetical protein
MGLQERLVLAVIEALGDDDPFVVVGVGKCELVVRWGENVDERLVPRDE